MISVSVEVSQQSINKVKQALERKLAQIQERTALKLYNFIVDARIDYARGPNSGAPARAPQWSGAYMASWNIQSGSIDTSHAVAPTSVRLKTPIFPRAENKYNINHTNYNVPIYISNMVENDQGESYAGAIENYGTPKHPNDPWKIARNAINVLKYF